MSQITDVGYLTRLREQRDFLQSEIKEYGNGQAHFAYKIASTLRTIFHKTSESKPILPDLAERYGINGVIHFSHWGCRQSCGGEYVVRDLMRQKGVPMLILNGDGADCRNYSEEPTKLRLDAFLEMLEAKR